MDKLGGAKAKRKPPSQKTCDCASYSVSAEIAALLIMLRELSAIRSTAEDAAARILDSAEGLLALANKEEAKKAENAILSIMTACGFHDLVGQRVTKITKTLDCVIARRLNGEKASALSQLPGEITLEGPAFSGRNEDQARIDAMFSKKN